MFPTDLSNYENIIPEICFSKRLREIKKVVVINDQYKPGDTVYTNDQIKYDLIKNLELNPGAVKILSEVPLRLRDYSKKRCEKVKVKNSHFVSFQRIDETNSFILLQHG